MTKNIWINISKCLTAGEGRALLEKWRPFYVNKGGDLRLQRGRYGQYVLQRKLVGRDFTDKTMQWNDGQSERMVTVYEYYSKYSKTGLAK